MSPRRQKLIIAFASIISIAGSALIGFAWAEVDPQRRPLIEGIVGACLIVCGIGTIITLCVRDKCVDAAFEQGVETGYRRGYGDGRRVGRPSVVKALRDVMPDQQGNDFNLVG